MHHCLFKVVRLVLQSSSASNRQYFSVFLLFAFVNMLIGMYIIAIVVLWGLIPVLLQWLIDNRYISANSLENRPSKKVFCYRLRWNVSGEIVSTHLAGRSLAWWKQALGRALNTSVWERSVFIWTWPSKLDFAAESCWIGELTKC